MKRRCILPTMFLVFFTSVLNAQSPDYPVVKGSAKDQFTIGEIVHEDNLDNQATFLSDWEVQMNSQGDFERYAKIIDGKLEVLDPSGCTIWLKKKLKGPLCISYKVIVSSERDTGNLIRPRDINNFRMAGEPGKLENILDSKIYTGNFYPSLYSSEAYPVYTEGYFGFRM